MCLYCNSCYFFIEVWRYSWYSWQDGDICACVYRSVRILKIKSYADFCSCLCKGSLWFWDESCEDCDLRCWKPKERKSQHEWGEKGFFVLWMKGVQTQNVSSLPFPPAISLSPRSWSAYGPFETSTSQSFYRMTWSSSTVLCLTFSQRRNKSQSTTALLKSPCVMSAPRRTSKMWMVCVSRGRTKQGFYLWRWVDDSIIVLAGYISKCVQLYETTVVRHGLMLVGPSGSGKTKVRPLLLRVFDKFIHSFPVYTDFWPHVTLST